MFDVAFLEDETIERFESDFKLVAKFFRNRRLGNRELFTDEKICHVQEFMDFLAVFTNDVRYKEIKQELAEMEKEGRSVTMCNVAQALEERGIKKGIEEGIEKGIEKGIKKGIEKGIKKGIEKGIKQERINIIQRMIRKGCSREEVIDILECTEEEFYEAENQFLSRVGN